MSMEAEKCKKVAGEKAAEFIEDGMVIGLGTGSTAYYTIKRVGEMIKEGVEVIAIPTSKWTENLAKECEIPISTLDEYPIVDLTIDGADEIDPQLNLIKGMGGALLREKVVASVSKTVIIIADESKLVDVLGTRSLLPVEVIPFAKESCLKALKNLCLDVNIRMENGTPYITDNQNIIIDCKFVSIQDPRSMEMELNHIPGVVENGLFVGLATQAIIGLREGVKIL